LKLAGGDRFKGIGVLCAGAHGITFTSLAPAGGRPQLKREPLGRDEGQMTRRALFILFALTGGPFVLAAQQGAPHSYVPDSGFVPDPATAIRIAEAVWIPIYGQVQIERERPFRAVLKDGVWTVTGSLPAGRVGGVAVAQIGRRDGRILRVSHGQ